MPVNKIKCCKTHTEEKEKSGECCHEERDHANDLSFENNGGKQEDKKNE